MGLAPSCISSVMAVDCHSPLQCCQDKPTSRPSSKRLSIVYISGAGAGAHADVQTISVAIGPIMRAAFGYGCGATVLVQ